MKKLSLISLLATSTLLTGCIVVDTPSNEFGLSLSNYTTGWPLDETVNTSPDIGTLPKGTPVICDNYDTQMTLTLNWRSGLGIKSYKVELVGERTGKTEVYDFVNRDVTAAMNTSGQDVFKHTFKPFAAPLSVGGNLQAQSIIVNPKTKTIDVLGKTYIRVTAYDLAGRAVTVKTDGIPVTKCAAN